MALNQVTLDDKYDLTKSRIFVTGFQAIVRLCLMQKELDRRAGLNTAGYVTGYRGSPLGTLDLQFMRAQRVLDKYDVRFQPGLGEDIEQLFPECEGLGSVHGGAEDESGGTGVAEEARA